MLPAGACQIVQKIPCQIGKDKNIAVLFVQADISHRVAADPQAHQCAENIPMRQGILLIKANAQAGNGTLLVEKVLPHQILGQRKSHRPFRALRAAEKRALRQELTNQRLLPPA